MSVAELIVELQAADPSAKVYYNDGEFGPLSVESVMKLDLTIGESRKQGVVLQ